jgi:transposase
LASAADPWCRENGVYPTELQQWKDSAVAALSEVPEEKAGTRESRDSRKRIRELERDLRRKDKALAETTALLVLSKQLQAIFQKRDEEE